MLRRRHGTGNPRKPKQNAPLKTSRLQQKEYPEPEAAIAVNANHDAKAGIT